MPVNNTPLVWDHASLSCCRSLLGGSTVSARRWHSDCEDALCGTRGNTGGPPPLTALALNSSHVHEKGRNCTTVQLPEKSPSPLSLPPRLPPGFPYCLLVCLTALVSWNLRTAWQEDWRTAKQKRYSNGSHVKLAPFVVVLADFSRELIIFLHNLHTRRNFGCFSNSWALCLSRYHFFSGT